MNKEELEKLLERIKRELLDPLDQIEAKRAARGIRRPPPISPEIMEHNAAAAAGFIRPIRRKRNKVPRESISVRIEPDLLKAAKARAAEEGFSLAGWICELVRKELNK